MSGEALGQLNVPDGALLSYDLFMGPNLHHSLPRNAKDVT